MQESNMAFNVWKKWNVIIGVIYSMNIKQNSN